ncbi:MAG: SpoIIE family protein phosphatase, partial [Candidatus Krumholzibacteria bacterium]|nr:SpoIIE family protein phosphatase [Candidatus Krumholzibacteria bacterium]
NYSIEVRHGIINIFEAFVAIYWVVYMLASLTAFIRTYVTSGRVQRIKFRIVIVGVALGIVPVSAVMLIKLFQPQLGIPYEHVSVIFLSFISISFAYAILKHGAFDLGIVFQRSLDFIILPVLLVSFYYFLEKGIGERFSSFLVLDHSSIAASAIILVALAYIPARAVVHRLAGKALYRSRKVFRDQVIEFSRRIQFLLSLEEVSDFVTREMHELFDAEYVHLFLRENRGNYIFKRSFPRDKKIPLTSFPPDTELIRLIKDGRLPMIMVEYFDKLWIKCNLDRISQELISISNVSVVVPLIEQRELFGFILIGPKRSQKPYTMADSEILELLSERSAAAIRNIELYSDSMEKDKLEKELRLASKIQERLLPKSPPTMKNATLLGGIRTSREVGGDFYDFVELANGKVGIAVADVSGKGIPAALLMTALQASFRAEVLHERSPGEILYGLNVSLFERSDTSKFATFFYATYDDNSGLLHFSNGGSFPPFVLKADGNIDRLQRGGILVGVEAESKYKEGMIKLKPGDLLVIYTDGFIDQEDEKGEPFGEQRLIEYFRNNLQNSLDSMIERLFATIFAFGQNNLKDDMTVVLLRRNLP